MQKTLSYIKYMADRYMKELNNPRETYSQNEEDKVAACILGRIERFIDVGANDGITFSNTYLFANCGAAGLCFEPVKLNCWNARLFHLLHPRVRCVNGGISRRSAEGRVVVEGYDGLLSYTISSNPTPGRRMPSNTKPVRLRPLSFWLSRYPKFLLTDLVSIDVEGHEMSVLESIDFRKFSTRCFIIETDKVSIRSIDEFLSPLGYRAGLTNDRNTFWFSRELVTEDDLCSVASRFDGYRLLE
jgi:FkbM family methyltransferase